MKTVKSLKDSSLQIKGITQIIENKPKEQHSGFLGILVGTLGTHLLKLRLAGQGVITEDNGVTTDAHKFQIHRIR